MRLPDLVAPVPTSYGHDGQLGQDDGPTDGRGHLLGALHPQPHVAVVVPNSNKRLQAEEEFSLLPQRHLPPRIFRGVCSAGTHSSPPNLTHSS